MQPHLPDHLVAKASQLCKPSSGEAHVKLILKNGRTIYDVVVGKGGEIVRAGGRSVYGEQDLRFVPSDIVEVSEY
jgi:hypothetical protein